MKREHWTLEGPQCPVKVVTWSGRNGGDTNPLGRYWVRGYFTIAASLINKNPRSIEVALGLKAGKLETGARILRFVRVPQVSEFEYELTAAELGGLAFNFMSDPSYPPGNRKIHQWRLKEGVAIPASVLVDLLPGQRFSFANGTSRGRQ